MKKIFIISAFIIGAASLNAAEAAIQLSLTPEIALYPKTTRINGLALDIWGENPQYTEPWPRQRQHRRQRWFRLGTGQLFRSYMRLVGLRKCNRPASSVGRTAW